MNAARLSVTNPRNPAKLTSTLRLCGKDVSRSVQSGRPTNARRSMWPVNWDSGAMPGIKMRALLTLSIFCATSLTTLDANGQARNMRKVVLAPEMVVVFTLNGHSPSSVELLRVWGEAPCQGSIEHFRSDRFGTVNIEEKSELEEEHFSLIPDYDSRKEEPVYSRPWHLCAVRNNHPWVIAQSSRLEGAGYGKLSLRCELSLLSKSNEAGSVPKRCGRKSNKIPICCIE